MANICELSICVGQSDRDKKWIAATNESPYFCFVGASEDEVLEKAKRALRYYISASQRLSDAFYVRTPWGQKGEGGIEPSSFHIWKTVKAKDLAAVE